jgi:molybdopterin molybdotransferase
MGHRSLFTARIRAIAGEPMSLGAPLTHYFRVRLTNSGNGLPRAMFTGPQASNIMSSVARADALLIVPADRGQVAAGDELDAIPLRDMIEYGT